MQFNSEEREAVDLLAKAIRERVRVAHIEAAQWQVVPLSSEYRKARHIIERAPALLASLDEIKQILPPAPTLRP